jgi:predicted deacylase
MLIVLAIIVIFVLAVWFRAEEFRVYRIGDTARPQVLLLAGTHGNEPAPVDYLEGFAEWLEQHPEEMPTDVHFVIVPRVNAPAVAAGVRATGADYNRCWPDPEGAFCSPVRDLVDQSHLVIDLHEAWGFESRDPGSLGQTIYTTDARLRALVSAAVERLNAMPEVKNNEEMRWRQLPLLPPLPDGRALDEYCRARGIPYILIETAGQSDIVPIELRRAQCREALATLIGIC